MIELYNKKFKNYYDEYNKLSDIKTNTYDKIFKPKMLKPENYDYDGWLIEK